MVVFSSHKSLKEALNSLDAKVSVGFVPTMGALHKGHLELINKAKLENDIVVVSTFVNPTQFLQGEDYELYPKKEEADKKICEVAGVDYLFRPLADELYGSDEIFIHAPNIRGYILEGASRPGHFNGVLTVVMKLLNIVQPTNAYFGKKDAQQLFLISLMAKQMFLNVNIVPVETMRDQDGLALSSRNSYLTAEQRVQALKIPMALRRATNMVIAKKLNANEIRKEMEGILSPLEISYIAVVNREFQALDEVEIGNSIILVEALVAEVRLLDNIWL